MVTNLSTHLSEQVSAQMIRYLRLVVLYLFYFNFLKQKKILVVKGERMRKRGHALLYTGS